MERMYMAEFMSTVYKTRLNRRHLHIDKWAPAMGSPEVMSRAVSACQVGNSTLLEECILEKLDVNTPDSEGCYLLHWAAINSRDSICERLIFLGADVNCIGGLLESTPLHWAAKSARLPTCVLLARHGAACDLLDKEGNTPLHVAIQSRNADVAVYLMGKFGYALEMRTAQGLTPTMFSAIHSYSMFPLKVFIEQYANLNAQENVNGNTALHLACQQGNTEAVRLLLAANADLTIKNFKSQTPLDVAMETKNIFNQEQVQKACRRRGVTRRTIFTGISDNQTIRNVVEFFLPALFGILSWIFFHEFNFLIALLLGAGTLYGMITFLTNARLRFDVNQSPVPLGIAIGEPIFATITWYFYLLETSPLWLELCYLFALVLFTFSIVKMVFGNPGVVPKSRGGMSFLVQAMEERPNKRFCLTCFIEKTATIKHCGTCNVCVKQFDHHCPWLRQCVTASNMRWFLLFIICVSLTSGLFSIACLFSIYDDFSALPIGVVFSKHSWTIPTGLVAAGHVPIMLSMFFSMIVQISNGETTYSIIKEIQGHTHDNNRKDGMISMEERRRNLVEICFPADERGAVYKLDDDEYTSLL